MIPDMTIRNAKSRDWLDVKVLMSTYFLDIDDIPIEDFIVATIDDRIIGAACLEIGTIAEVHSIAVHPNYRGKGVGRSLFDALISGLENFGFLYTRTTSPVFFEKTGFIRLDDSKKKELWDDCAGCNRFNNCKQSVLRLEIMKKER